jgi:hypothetical protein
VVKFHSSICKYTNFFALVIEKIIIPLDISPGVGLLDHMAGLCLDFLRSLQIFFQSGCTSLHSHQQWTRVPFSPHPRQHMLVVVFLMIAILTGVRWNLSEVLICISFMTRDGEHFFMFFGHLNFFF